MDPLSIAELARRTDQHTDKIEDLRDRLGKLETTTAVRDERDKSIDTRLSKIESGQQWLIRTVLGGILAAAAAYLYGGAP